MTMLEIVFKKILGRHCAKQVTHNKRVEKNVFYVHVAHVKYASHASRYAFKEDHEK